MRILYISGETVPGDIGGSVHVWEVAKNLSELGHEITLLVNKNSGEKNRETLEEVKIIRTNIKIFGKTFPILHLKKILSFDKYDVVIERFSIVGGLGAIISKMKNIPLLLEINGPHLYEAKHLGFLKGNSLKYELMKKLVEIQYNCASVMFGPLYQLVPDKYRKKFISIEWGVNEKLFSNKKIKKKEKTELRKNLGINEDDFVFIFTGSLRIWHGIDDLVKVASKIKNLKIKFLIVGSGNLEENLKKLASENRVKNIIFAGKIKYSQMPLFISLADVGIAPYNTNHYEPLNTFGFYWSPFKIFEYMAMEKPVLLPDIHRLVWLTGKKNIFYNHGDLNDLKKNILNTVKARKKLLETGKENREIVLNNYTWKKHCNKLNKIIKSVVKENGGINI